MGKGKFATAINCIDGRVQYPMLEWMKENLNVNYVDMVTEPGPDRVLSGGSVTGSISIKERVSVSVNAHGSGVVAIAGHYDCAGNPVPDEEHINQIRRSVKAVLSWGLGVRVLGLFVNENCQVETVEDSREMG